MMAGGATRLLLLLLLLLLVAPIDAGERERTPITYRWGGHRVRIAAALLQQGQTDPNPTRTTMPYPIPLLPSYRRSREAEPQPHSRTPEPPLLLRHISIYHPMAGRPVLYHTLGTDPLYPCDRAIRHDRLPVYPHDRMGFSG